MEITERLLRNEIHHLSEDLKALSSELIFIQKFIKVEFGEKYAKFREQQILATNRENPVSSASSHRSSRNLIHSQESISPLQDNVSKVKSKYKKANITRSIEQEEEQTETLTMAEDIEAKLVEEVDFEVASNNEYYIEDESQDYDIADDSERGSDLETFNDEYDDYTSVSAKKSDDPDFNPSKRTPKTKAAYKRRSAQNETFLKDLKRPKLSPTKIGSTPTNSEFTHSANNSTRKKHSVWKYFELDKETNLSKCLIPDCPAILKQGQFSTCLLHHLKGRHLDIYYEVVADWKEKKDARKLAVMMSKANAFGSEVKPIKLE